MASPSRWPKFCATAWEGVVASQYGLFCDPVYEHRDRLGNRFWMGGYDYTISTVEWLKCGCPWCRFLAKRFLRRMRRQRNEWRVEVRVKVGRYLWSQGDDQGIIIVVDGYEGYFTLWTTEGDPAARWIKNRIIIPHVGWPYALAEAKTCVEECIRNHPQCQAVAPYPIGAAPLPTRLIDCSDPGCLRLVETNPGMCGTYVALSYVWGEEQPHQTTKANLSLYKDRIDPAILPQTLRDAIHVTRALGINLLWIDGLCIVQDSEKDMHHELARMRNVYRHAFVTIDASSAARVSEGFLQDRELIPMPEAVLPFICPSGNSAEQSADGALVGMFYLGEIWSKYSTWQDSEDVDGKPLSHTVSRGWCLQERLLSTRSLVFTSETLQLRCHTQTQNVGGAHHDGDNDVPRLPDAVFHPDRHVAPGSDEWKHIHERWWDIVEDYTYRKLTNPSDRLVAISALAEMFAPTLGPDYLAGHWRNTLLEDLFWSYDSFCSLSPTEYCGPSWSWAYTDNSMSWRDSWETGVPFAEIIRCTVTLQNEDLPFGSVTGASLILRSSLLPCKWNLEQLDPVEYDLVPEFPIFSWLSSLDQRLYFKSDVDITDLLGIRMWFLPLKHYYSPHELCMNGLVVCRADTDVLHSAGAYSQGDVYRRVGLATLWDSVAAKEDSMDTLNDSDVYSMLSQIPRVDIELV
ncbi:HET-domain-containing protein [Cubamyces sp. BRFM 1775]|nr:HET-domain-containing protein [Cubamyces sp. BRFM 1775]